MIRRPIKKPLWCGLKNNNEPGYLAFWKALVIAFSLEFFIPFLLFFVNWPFNFLQNEPDITALMTVNLESSILEETPPVPDLEEKKEKKKNKIIENMEQIPLAEIEPLPNEVTANIQIPKPKPEPEIDEEEDLVELPPLPSVFQDIKPVKKVKPKYPRDAEEDKIEGRVKVRMKVELDGTVSNVKLIFSEPQGVFEKVVIEAAEKFIFKKDGTSFYADESFVFIIDP